MLAGELLGCLPADRGRPGELGRGGLFRHRPEAQELLHDDAPLDLAGYKGEAGLLARFEVALCLGFLNTPTSTVVFGRLDCSGSSVRQSHFMIPFGSAGGRAPIRLPSDR